MRSLSKRKLSLVFACLCTVPLPASIALGQTVIATIPISGYAGQGAVDPVARKVYLPNGYPEVIVIDAGTTAAGLFEASPITTPAVGAGSLRVTVPTAPVPPTTPVGAIETLFTI